jgi:energy-coupling factor transport system permease protein
MNLVPVYRQRASALHSARAGIAASLCLALALVGALYAHPLVLAAALAAIAGAGIAAGVGREVWRGIRLALPFALLIALVNPLVYQGGDTLLIRGGAFLGRRFDVTLEAIVAGGFAGTRLVVIIAALGLMSAAVDPDELLRLFRRISYRSALSASLATRLVPVLARDATRMGEAARCRPRPVGRVAVARTALAGALDRAVDVAAALEVRGYALGGRPARQRRPWSRHDARVAVAAAGVATCAVAMRLAGAASVEAYPRVEVALGPPELALIALMLGFVAVPFAGRHARLGVAHG